MFLSGRRCGKQPGKQSNSEVDFSSQSVADNNVCLESFNNPQLKCHLLEQPQKYCDGLPESGEPHETSDSDVSSGTHPSMDGSWLVTPPACFTAGISQMETSSMENLLIEHPSMSVYQHRGRHSSTGLDSEQSESSGDEEQPDQTEQQEVSTGQANLPHRPRVLNTHVGLTQVKTIKAMQRAQQHHVYKDLSKKNLNRGNLTRYTQGKVSRKQVVHQPRARMAFYTKRH